MENPIQMDDLGVPLFLETSIWFPGSAIKPLISTGGTLGWGGWLTSHEKGCQNVFPPIQQRRVLERKAFFDLQKGSWIISLCQHFSRGFQVNYKVGPLPVISRWWFQINVLFSPLLGEDSHFDAYFSDRLKPPTR